MGYETEEMLRDFRADVARLTTENSELRAAIEFLKKHCDPEDMLFLRSEVARLECDVKVYRTRIEGLLAESVILKAQIERVRGVAERRRNWIGDEILNALASDGDSDRIKVVPDGSPEAREADAPREPRIFPTDPENGCGPGGWREP